MDRSLLAPSSLEGAKKQRAMQDAKDMSSYIVRNAERANVPVPPYDFIELIGKGGSGRVYKCRRQSDGELVAIKIINTDDIDYASHALDKDDTIRDFRKEVSILNQLKDSHAKNVNMIHDAFDFQEQLWIISDYCTGGSVRTLMKGRQNPLLGLEEQFLIPIARELALAMKSVHDIGIIHRDIKCTNVYINERGQIQLGDFGIVGIVDDGASKRRTIIGTPHYMPPELHVPTEGNQAQEAYGKEIDIWSFGCSVYEMATGQPPHASVTEINELNQVVLNDVPRLDDAKYSPELCDFVAFCLCKNVQDRPTAEQVLEHHYIAGTQKKYPTSILVHLVERYKIWEMGGGQRQSLWMPGGAPDVPSAYGDPEEGEDDWNFSTSHDFDVAFEKRYSQMVENHAQDAIRSNIQTGLGLPSILNKGLSPFEHIMQQHRDLSADRGERSLERLWKPDTMPYQLHAPLERSDDDLPLRSAQTAPTRESQVMIDLDEVGMDDSQFNFDFDDMPTVKARRSRPPERPYDGEEDEYQYGQIEEDREKRATMEWTFPTQKRATMDWTFPKRKPSEPRDPLDSRPSMDLGPLPEDGENTEPPRPPFKHTTTEPLGQFGDFVHQSDTTTTIPSFRESSASMIDLDLSLADPEELVRPSTAISTTGSTTTDMTSGNPFDLDDDLESVEMDRNRFSYHKQWQSDGSQVDRNSRKSIPMHSRGSSMSSTDSELQNKQVFNAPYERHRLDSTYSQSDIERSESSNEWQDFDSSLGVLTGPDTETVRRASEAPAAVGITGPETSMSNPRTVKPGLSGRPIIEFPALVGPHPDALYEDAEQRNVVSELERLLDDFAGSLGVTKNAFKRYAAASPNDLSIEAVPTSRSVSSLMESEEEMK